MIKVEEWVNEIRERALSGKPPVSSWRSNKTNRISFDDLVFIPVPISERPIDYFKEEIFTETIIGKSSEKPLKLKIPILISAMSFGAVSKEVKLALAKASSIVGTATNTGEGGMLPEERENSKLLIAQYSTGRFGVDENYIKKADAIEIKFGQGAKVGFGGYLPAEKVTGEIAKLRRVPLGQDIHSPPYHPDIKNVKDLKKKIEWIKDINGGKPVIIKIGAGNVEDDIKFIVKADADVIAIDCLGGGTGAAQKVMLNEFGIPTVSALVKARKILDKLKAKQELIIGGGLNIGADVAKSLALGADTVYMASSLLIAMGCTYCKLCYKGKCPVGITTQDPELRKKLDPKAVEHVVNFLKACTEEVKMVAAACGKRNIHELNRNYLRSLDLTISKITGIPLV